MEERRESAAASDEQDLGSILKAARERAGLSLADVSKQLNLDQAIVAALEGNNFSELPAAAFVRGYLRAYAKLLDLDSMALIGIFNRTGANDPDIAPVSGIVSQRASNDPLMRWMSLAVIVVLAAMVGVWWQTNNGLAPGEPPATAVSEVPFAVTPLPGTAPGDDTLAAGDAPPASAGADLSIELPQPPVEAERPRMELPVIEAVPEGETQGPLVSAVPVEAPAQPPAPAPTPAGVVVEPFASQPQGDTVAGESTVQTVEVSLSASGPASASGGGGAPSERAATPAAPADAREIALAAPAVAPAASAASAAATVAEAPPPPPLAAGEGDELVLVTRGESWVEISDADGRKLFYGLHDSRRPLNLSGVAPFKVFLGNSPDVEIQFNGGTVDQSPFNRTNNTARFVVDAAGVRRR